MNADPAIEEFIDALRPALEFYLPQFLAGTLTSVDIETRQERKQRRRGWAVRVKPESDAKVLLGWEFDRSCKPS